MVEKHFADGRTERTIATGGNEFELHQNILGEVDRGLKQGATRIFVTPVENKYAPCPCGSKEPFANCCGKGKC